MIESLEIFVRSVHARERRFVIQNRDKESFSTNKIIGWLKAAFGSSVVEIHSGSVY